MYIKNPPALFSYDQIQKIEDMKKAKYVCATEHQGHTVEVFYSEEAHPVSNSRYFALYYTHLTNELMITDGSFIEKQDIDAVVADDGDIVYSRYRHDYMVSNDKSVWIDGGRAYTRSGLYSDERHVKLKVRDGCLELVNE
jgi:hypothetical protein